MPAGRPRKSHNSQSAHASRSATHSQSTLSFNNKSRVTKPSVSSDAAGATKKAQTEFPEPSKAEATQITSTVTPEPEAEVETVEDTLPAEKEISIRSSPRKKLKSTVKRQEEADSSEAAARKITDAQLKKYWQAEEDARLAPRVHQSGLSTNEKILRHFDLSSQYGPCIGITRIKRWKRAHGLGLDPPLEVLAVLLKEEAKGAQSKCGKLAYIDELAGGRVVLVE